MRVSKKSISWAVVSVASAISAQAALGADIVKDNNATALNVQSSWLGGVIPGANDVAAWTAASSPNGLTVASGASLSFGGIRVGDVTGPVTVTGNTITTGRFGIDMSAAGGNLTLPTVSPLAGIGQTWNVAGGRTLTISGAIASTSGQTNITGAGPTVFTSGTANTLIAANYIANGRDFAGLNSSLQVIPGRTASPATYLDNPQGTITQAPTQILDFTTFNTSGNSGVTLGVVSGSFASYLGFRFNTPSGTNNPTGAPWVVDASKQYRGVDRGVLVGADVDADVNFTGSATSLTNGFRQNSATAVVFRNYSLTHALNIDCGLSEGAGTNNFIKAGPGTVRMGVGALLSASTQLIVEEGTLELYKNFVGSQTGSGSALIAVNGGRLVLNSTNTTTAGSSTEVGMAFASGTDFSGTGAWSGVVTLNSGASVSPGNSSIGSLRVGSLNFTGGVANFEIASDGMSNDTISVTASGGLSLNGGTFNVLQAGTTNTYSTPGSYNLISYAGAIAGAGIASIALPAATPTTAYTLSTASNAIVLTIGAPTVTANYWNVDADGIWGVAGNWSLGTVPDAPGAFASFGGGGVAITAPRTITIQQARTVGVLNFNSAFKYTVAATGTGGLTLDNNGAPGVITDAAGSHEVSAPVTVTSSGALANVVGSADTLTMSGPISGGSISKAGAGTVALTGANTFAGLSVGGGTVRVGTGGSVGSGDVSISANALLLFNRSDSYNLSTNYTGADGTIKFDGTGTATLSGTSTVGVGTTALGNLTVAGGRVIVANAAFIPANANVVVNGGTLDLNGQNLTVATLNGGAGGVITDFTTGGTTTLTSSSANRLAQTYNGSINEQPGGNVIALVRTNPATASAPIVAFTLGGSSNYSGGTIIGAGVNFTITNGNAVGTGLVQLQPGASTNSQLAEFITNGSFTVRNDFSLQGYNAGSQGDIRVAGANDTVVFTGAITTSQGGVQASGSAFLQGPSAGLATFTGRIASADAHAVTIKSGNVRLAYSYASGDNAYPQLGVFAGTTSLGADNAIPATADLNLATAAAATLDLNGHSTTIANVVQSATTNTRTFSNSGAAGAVLTLTGNLGGNGDVTVSTGAKVLVANPGQSGQRNLPLLLNNNGIALTGGTLAFAPTGDDVPRNLIVVNSITATAGSVLDVGNSDILLKGGDETAIEALAGQGRIKSTLSGTGTGRDLYTGVGIILNGDGMGGQLFGSFDDQGVSASTILLKYTYLGDTDLNGYVDGNDLANLIAGMNGHLSGWVNGDINYDGTVNGTDLGLLLNSLRHQGVAFSDSGSSGGSIPEPAALGLALPAIGLLGRRRRA